MSIQENVKEWLKLSTLGKLLSVLIVLVIVLTYAIRGLYKDVRQDKMDTKKDYEECRLENAQLRQQLNDSKNDLILVLKALNGKTTNQILKVDSLTTKK